MKIAIDGPAGAGKSSVARLAAGRLGFLYVDTGAMYRAVGLYALRKGADPANPEAVGRLLPEIDLRLGCAEGVQHVYLGGEDVSEAIRTPEASMAASAVSAIPAVRAFLLERQRAFGRGGSVVMDGRDIGTVIFPDAEVKIYMTASAEERASRRCRELREKGTEADYAAVLADIRARDYNDSHRAEAPLRPAEGAVVLDTTRMDLETTVQEVLRIVKEAEGK